MAAIGRDERWSGIDHHRTAPPTFMTTFHTCVFKYSYYKHTVCEIIYVLWHKQWRILQLSVGRKNENTKKYDGCIRKSKTSRKLHFHRQRNAYLLIQQMMTSQTKCVHTEHRLTMNHYKTRVALISVLFIHTHIHTQMRWQWKYRHINWTLDSHLFYKKKPKSIACKWMSKLLIFARSGKESGWGNIFGSKAGHNFEDGFHSLISNCHTCNYLSWTKAMRK